MRYIFRHLTARLTELIQRGKSVLLLGPRQTGKTTMLQELSPDLAISFVQPRVRLQYELDPSSLADEVEAMDHSGELPLIIIDEVQKVPEIMDVVQDLVDRKLGRFILTGSSARKLKNGPHMNLLPGRVVPLHMDPLMLTELKDQSVQLSDLLLYGSLPEIILNDSDAEREDLLEAYVTLYLEEEVRAEALVRHLASFAKFLSLAMGESGHVVNFSKLSQHIGVSRAAITEYYQILEDCLIAEVIEPLTVSKTRHKLSKSKKYLMFDLGVRRVAAGEGLNPTSKTMGHLFEQFVGLALLRQSRIKSSRLKLRYWKDNDGPEVDWVLEHDGVYVPIEVKYTDRPGASDARHLKLFMREYPCTDTAYIVCQVPRARQISDHVVALPWQDLSVIVEQLS